MNSTAEILQFRAKEEREERRVADLDDGYTRLATMLLEEYAGANLNRRHYKVLLAVLRLTYGWNKKLDRMTDQQISDICKLPRQKVNEAKNELISMNIIAKSGNKIGPNKNVSEWDFNLCHQNGDSVTNPVTKSVTKMGIAVSPKQGHSIDIIPKTVKTDPPKAPKGETGKEFSEHVLAEAKQALEYYNELTDGSCRSAEPFAVLLTETKSRSAYTLQDLQLVVRWVVRTWKRRNNTVAKPMNICRVNRFDGYLSDAEAWQKTCVDIDCQAVIDAYNAVTDGRMAPAELYRDRELAIRELACHLAKQTVDGFRAYFEAFLTDAREFHFGGPDGLGWRANFDYLMKPETLRNVKEGTL
ncbi:MAG: replication protein [Ewingella americana]|jgi:phage replication O-like protein O|uniref:replication protein n=1 Tax=Ewingella americana TaxID=41202 RepID=UPI00242C2597|nr:replication protein [Ewingella americana]MCI1676610.1 replication protein [Ewingella americana]MCI1853800.1 replication protein [Ewingella americana]MCI1859959.1 replication protein [Ewingella americana]MCI2142287.1 replication protein [Ewingella americana]MCI2163250.1 replication protein [Ewingella americana]